MSIIASVEELEAIYGQPNDASTVKVADRITPEYRKLIDVSPFAALEDEMCDFGADGLSGGRSPDRVDALVWAVTELMPERSVEPRIRVLG